MRRLVRLLLILLAAGAVVVSAVLISFAVLLQGSGLRSRVEQTLARSLGRPVTIAQLRLSPWTGSVVAEDLRIADDPTFGSEPFLHAQRVRLGIEIIPLLLRREIRIKSLALEEPSIRLLRNAAGTWNFRSLERPHQEASTDSAPRTLPDLAISSLAVEDGHVLIHIDPLAGTAFETRELRFYRVHLGVRHFDLTRAFAFDLSSALPPGGKLEVTGTAGPWNQADLAATPVTAQVHLRQLDLEVAGLVGHAAPSSLSGQIPDAKFDLAWHQDDLALTHLVVDSPRLTLPASKPAASAAAAVPHRRSFLSELLERLTLEDIKVHHGTLTEPRAGAHTLTVHDLELTLDSWSGKRPPSPAAGWSTFHSSGVFATRATFTSNGRFRALLAQPDLPPPPIDVEAHVAFNQLDLESSGLVTPGTPFSGQAMGNVDVQSLSGTLRAGGDVRIDRLKLARTGQPSPYPLQVNFHLSQHAAEGVTAGTLDHAAVTLGASSATHGASAINIAGTYRLGGLAAVVDLHTTADALPIDQIQAFLPALGVQLPEGSRLTGGTLTTSLAIAGPASNLTITGPVRLDATRLMGFDLGSKLASLSRFTGGRVGSAASPGTSLRSLSLDLRAGGGQVVTNNITADIAGIGVATGSGTVGAGATLDYRLTLKWNELIQGPSGGEGMARDLASLLPGKWAARAQSAIDSLAKGAMKNGIPVLIGGTARHPTVTPNLGSLLPPQSGPTPYEVSPARR